MIGLNIFIDPVLRAPIIGAMLMCLSASLVGVIVFVRKSSLLGEALSHAAYPGVTGAIVLTGILSLHEIPPFLIFFGAACSSIIGFFLINFLEKKVRVSSDASLCFALAFSFGIGITIASYAQNFYTAHFRQIQNYLYGQVATMTDQHILIYAILAFVVISSITIFYKEILAVSFDGSFAKTSGIASSLINLLFLSLVVAAVVIGIRSVGVILMSAMLIAPAAAARQFTNYLSRIFIISGLFGIFSGYFGTYLSLIFNGIPTGPLIVLISGVIAFYALFFAPERGLFVRYWRALKFRNLQMQENLLKLIWRISMEGRKKLSFVSIFREQGASFFQTYLLLLRLRLHRWLEKNGSDYQLTILGINKSRQIIRLHRLWEVYLVNALGLGVERVHKSAEEMEHILTPELERELTKFLDDPKYDPHDQPIPSGQEVIDHG
ncbi:MAG: iron chelate uptake ABC transporter family permease subunit [Chlamydiales bacterium]